MKTPIIRYEHPFRYTFAHSIAQKLQQAFFKLLTLWIPKANPDYDDKMNETVYWYIEVDKKTGYSRREIGFGIFNKPLLYDPTDRNYGFWNDSGKVFTLENYELIGEKAFNTLWDNFIK